MAWKINWTPEMRAKAAERMRGRKLSPEARAKISAKQTPEARAATSKRMRAKMLADNPMSRPEVRERVSRTLREIGHRPKLQGGNGRGLTEPQKVLLAALGRGWKPEHIVTTGGRALGLPHHYKIDIANPRRKIAIEIDGNSHCALRVKKADRRKTAFLVGLGWTVLRYSNQEAMERTAELAQMVSSTTSK